MLLLLGNLGWRQGGQSCPFSVYVQEVSRRRQQSLLYKVNKLSLSPDLINWAAVHRNRSRSMHFC